jgi:hypothetical protein
MSLGTHVTEETRFQESTNEMDGNAPQNAHPDGVITSITCGVSTMDNVKT